MGNGAMKWHGAKRKAELDPGPFPMEPFPIEPWPPEAGETISCDTDIDPGSRPGLRGFFLGADRPLKKRAGWGVS